MQVSLKDKVALVTGAAHRVGRAIALELARHGAHIVLHYHSSPIEVVQAAMSEIGAQRVQVEAIQADLSQPDAITQLFERVQSVFGRLDILVNSASAFQKRGLLEITLEDWEHTMQVNLRAPFLCTQAAARMMLAQAPRGGVIINICDQGVFKPWPDYAHHGISKAGLHALTMVTAASLGPHIRANAVVPGPVLKPPTMPDDRWRELGERSPLQRTGAAEDVARA
ncbi:MAG: SDR family oxidoreductase, partial [Chloroflexi bacterium]